MRYDGPAATPYQPPPPGPSSAGPPVSHVLMVIATVCTGAWIVATTAILQLIGWSLVQTGLAIGQAIPAVTWFVVALANLVGVAAPAGLIWWLAGRFTPRLAGVLAAARAWTLAGVAGGLLDSLRIIPEPQNEILLLATTLAAALMAAVLRLTAGASTRGRIPADSTVSLGRSFAKQGTFDGFALTAGLLVLLPWLWAGALGGATETVLAVTAAGAFGWLAATILGPGFFRAYGRSRVWLVLVGGSATGVTLVPLGAGLGGRGVNLVELVLLPALGFTAAALAAAAGPSAPRRRWVAALVGLGAVGPLAFVDPEETTLLLGFSDVGFWALVATLIGVGIALVTGAAYGLVLSPRRVLKWWIPATAALLVAVAGTAVYGVAGRPGFYGERLFVVLADQADLSGLDTIADRPTRIRATYQRLVRHAEASQAPLRESLDRWGLHYTPYYLVNAILVDGGPVVRQWLAGRSDVDRVLLDQRVRPLPTSTPTERGSAPTPDGAPQWNIAMIGAPRVWSEFGDEGEGIVIGTSDSGVDGSHPDIKGAYRGGDDSWYDPWNGTHTPTAHNGHGTHTIGTALGRNGIGVAPRAQWIGCVDLDRDLGSPSRYLDCLQFMLAPFPMGADPWRDGRPERAPDVLTNSWGCPTIEGCDARALGPATAAFKAAGIFFVAAAGNTGPYCSSVDDPPAPYPDVLTVGAVDRSRRVTDFSSRGPTGQDVPRGDEDHRKPDLVAPGMEVLSAMPDGTYKVDDGTSMAAPHVAGVVALMWSANPALIGDIDTTTRILRDTATPATPTYRSSRPADACGSPANVAGAGLVNAYAAVSAARDVR